MAVFPKSRGYFVMPYNWLTNPIKENTSTLFCKLPEEYPLTITHMQNVPNSKLGYHVSTLSQELTPFELFVYNNCGVLPSRIYYSYSKRAFVVRGQTGVYKNDLRRKGGKNGRGYKAIPRWKYYLSKLSPISFIKSGMDYASLAKNIIGLGKGSNDFDDSSDIGDDKNPDDDPDENADDGKEDDEKDGGEDNEKDGEDNDKKDGDEDGANSDADKKAHGDKNDKKESGMFPKGLFSILPNFYDKYMHKNKNKNDGENNDKKDGDEGGAKDDANDGANSDADKKADDNKNNKKESGMFPKDLFSILPNFYDKYMHKNKNKNDGENNDKKDGDEGGAKDDANDGVNSDADKKADDNKNNKKESGMFPKDIFSILPNFYDKYMHKNKNKNDENEDNKNDDNNDKNDDNNDKNDDNGDKNDDNDNKNDDNNDKKEEGYMSSYKEMAKDALKSDTTKDIIKTGISLFVPGGPGIIAAMEAGSKLGEVTKKFNKVPKIKN